MKSIIITGATSGIGYECAIQIAKTAPDEQIVNSGVFATTEAQGIQFISLHQQLLSLLCTSFLTIILLLMFTYISITLSFQFQRCRQA